MVYVEFTFKGRAWAGFNHGAATVPRAYDKGEKVSSKVKNELKGKK